MTSQSILITGSTAGIGLELARQLGEQGHTVYIASRSMEKVDATVEKLREETGNYRIEGFQLDLSSFAAIQNFLETFLAKTTSLDVLVLNAGIFKTTGLTFSPDGIEETIATNHFGHFFLTETLLKRIPIHRIVVVSSGTHDPKSRYILPRPFYDPPLWTCPPVSSFDAVNAYTNSKLANALYGLYLSRTTKDVSVCVYDPGFIGETSLFRCVGVLQPFMRFFNRSVIAIRSKWYGIESQVSSLEKSVGFMKRLVTETEMDVNGRYFSMDKEKEPSELAQNEKLQDDLAEYSKKVLAEKVFA